MIEKSLDYSIKTRQNNGGVEFDNHNFRKFCKDLGIIHKFSSPYTPEQNGLLERKHRHIISTARCFFTQFEVSKKYWLEAISTVVHCINRMPSKITKFSSHFSLLNEKEPNVNYFRVFVFL